MITIAMLVLAALAGVVLAGVDGPYAFDRARVERFSILLLVTAVVVLAAGGVVLVCGWLLG